MEIKRQRMIVEAFDCDCSVLNSVEFIYRLLEETCRVIDMRIVVPPVVVRIPVANAVDAIATNSDCGVSGVVILLESGIQVHTWPEHRFLALDIFSCRAFDGSEVCSLIMSEVRPRCLSTREL